MKGGAVEDSFKLLEERVKRAVARLRELAARYNVSRAYTNYCEMLQDAEIDTVSVVTMWDQHAAPATKVH